MNLSKIIHARVVEIIEQVFAEIKIYGHEDPRKKLIAGIVLTGGGAQLKHIKQLVEYITGMDTRIGYPNEHLAGNSSEEISSPLFATAVGLVMNSVANNTQSAYKLEMKQNYPPQRPMQSQPIVEEIKEYELEPNEINEEPKKPVKAIEESTEEKIKKSFFDKYVIKLKDFLDNAE
jgi:cell division protein FtsA